MPVTVLVGCQWGDEGKGKIVDVLAPQVDIVARYQGGNNAGHTVVVGEKKYVLHTLPSGVLHDGVLSVIGNGVVVDLLGLRKEIEGLASQGRDVLANLRLSEQAHLILPQHGMLDRVKEKSAGDSKIGTTGRGIGIAYAEKMARRGLRACDIRHKDHFVKKYRAFADYTNEILEKVFNEPRQDAEEHLELLLETAEILKPIIVDTVTLLNDACKNGKNILAEGAQGVLLDIDHGTYPFVTSSSPSSGGACTGLGLAPQRIDSVIGIVKAYTTRVGEGPMPTELNNEDGELLRKEGGEFGATTGRPRRCGWFDGPATRRSIQIAGATEITLTKLDVLSVFDEIPVCTSYDVNGESRPYMPFDLEEAQVAKPVLEKLSGWKDDITSVKSYTDLPDVAKKYVDYLENYLEVPITRVSVGPDRAQTLDKN